MAWFAKATVFDGLIPMLVGRMNLRPETVKPETGLVPVLVGRMNLKPETMKPETALVPVLLDRTIRTPYGCSEKLYSVYTRLLVKPSFSANRAEAVFSAIQSQWS